MSTHNVFTNKATEEFFRSIAKPDESIASCLGRIAREYAATHSAIIDAETIHPNGKSACVINLANIIREGK